jgi:hypothetical protein
LVLFVLSWWARNEKNRQKIDFERFRLSLILSKWPRQESNLHLQNRNLKFYPLKYGAMVACERPLPVSGSRKNKQRLPAKKSRA